MNDKHRAQESSVKATPEQVLRSGAESQPASPAEKRLPPNLLLPVLGSLTLGLAPFLPQPHIWGKLMWLAGGGVGMTVLDWGDLFLHGSPWGWLAVSLIRRALASR